MSTRVTAVECGRAIVSVFDGFGWRRSTRCFAPEITAVLLRHVRRRQVVADERAARRGAPRHAGDPGGRPRGRATPVRRDLVGLPKGALLIDTPGLRLVAPLDDHDEPVRLQDPRRRPRRHADRPRRPVTNELDLRSLGERARIADTANAERTTGYVAGGISPLGRRRALPTLVDDSALEHDTIYVSVGRRGLENELPPGDLVALTNADLRRLRHAA